MLASRMRISLSGIGTSSHQTKKPLGAEVLLEFEHGGEIAPRLLAEPVAEPIALTV
jgi:hypothetical protein